MAEKQQWSERTTKKSELKRHQWCYIRAAVENPKGKKSGGTAAKREKKKRLVSYSSQDLNSSIEATTSRRIGRKRTAVTKMGGVMIDHISKKRREKVEDENEIKLKAKSGEVEGEG